MRLIVAPAKNMRSDLDGLEPQGLPRFLDQTAELLAWLRRLSPAELQKLWGCNDAIAALNVERVARMDLRRDLTPAILAYDGIQYKYMAPAVFDEGQYAYVQERLRIVSGFYGLLRPMDGVTPYRLELHDKARVDGTRSLYDFWGTRIHDVAFEDDPDRCVVNLASAQYARPVERHLQPGERFVTCVFGELEGATDGGPGDTASTAEPRLVQKGVYVKMARGEMVRYAADVDARTPEDLVGFDRLGYRFDPARSDGDTLVFLRTEHS